MYRCTRPSRSYLFGPCHGRLLSISSAFRIFPSDLWVSFAVLLFRRRANLCRIVRSLEVRRLLVILYISHALHTLRQLFFLSCVPLRV